MAIDENRAGRAAEGIPSGGLLNNLRVLDLGQGVSGPFCARLLADQGAAVIKVEPPEGDPARRMGPFAGDEPHSEKSIPFLYLNTNKHSITLNLSTAAGRTLLHALVCWADVLVENFEPRLRSSLGLDDKSLRDVNPRLVVTSITRREGTRPRLAVPITRKAVMPTTAASMKAAELVNAISVCPNLAIGNSV